MSGASEPGNRILVVGWDGGTWTAFRPLVERGRMPNLAALMARGCHGVMRSTIPPYTPPAWTTMLTGVRPGRHRVFSFFEGRMPSEAHVAGREGAPIVSANSVRLPSLEDVLGRSGRRVLLVNLPLAWPPKPVNGVLITGMLTPPDAESCTYPAEVRAALVDYEIDICHSLSVQERAAQAERLSDGELARACTRMERSRTENVLRLAAREKFDFAMVLHTGTDRVFHRLWPAFVRMAAGGPDDGMSRLLDEFAAEMDRSLGRLVEAFPDATVLLLSDHGFGPGARRVAFPDLWLEQQGYLARRLGAGAGRRRRPLRRAIARAIRAVLPAGLSRLIFRVSRDRVQRMQDAIDPERTRCCVTLVEAAYGGIRFLGPKDRDLEGRIMAGLRELTDPATGERVVGEVWRRDDLYGPGLPDTLPDIIFEYREGFTGSVDPDARELVADNDEGSAGTHRADGMFVLAGPGVRPLGDVGHLELADVMPLTLALAGVAIPAGLDGRVPLELLDPRPAGCAPGDSPASAPSEAPGPQNPYSAEQEQQVKDHLHRLGYL